jgi:16S rRNA (uracil1498-N3)-methyltransferase
MISFSSGRAVISVERPPVRLYIPEPLAAGASVPLTDENLHRLRNVLRLSAGATVAAFNERDGEFLCHIDQLRRTHGTLKAIEQRRAPEPGPDVWLLFAPIKRARLEWLVEKATELGVAALVPVVTARTQSERVNRERLRVIAVAASEQSERVSLPEIRPEVALARLLADWPADRRLVLCDESGAGQPMAEALAGSDGRTPTAVFVGPEGGFAETELDALGKLSIVTRVGLGPRILRTETAALAALAVYQAVAGDWRLIRGR